MATELGSAFISVGLGTNSLAGDIRKAFGSAESEGSTAGKSAGGGFGKAFGIAAAAIGAIGIGSFFKDAVSGAANLEQSVGAIDSVFKGSAGQMHEWAKSAATNVGLSANEFNELGTLIGSQLKNGGTAMEELGPKTNELIGVGADLASMFGGTTSDAVGALSSALKGERDPIEKYGVSLNQAKIDAEAAALGFDDVKESSAQQAATLSLIMKQTADAQGNFGRETDTLAHKQQVLNAQIANGKARIGDELLPVVSALTGALSKALGPAIDITVAAIHGLVTGISGVFSGMKSLIMDGDVTPALLKSLGVEEDSPVISGLLFLQDKFWAVFRGIQDFMAGFSVPFPDLSAQMDGSLGGVFDAGLKLKDAVRTVYFGISDFIAGFTMPKAEILPEKFGGLVELGSKVREFFGGLAAAIGPLFAALIPLASAFSPMQIIFAAIQPLLPQLLDMFLQLASVLGGSLLVVLTDLTPMFVQLSGVVSEALGGVIAAVLPTVVTMITMLGQTIAQLLPIITPIIATLVRLATTLIGQLMPIITDLVASILPPLVDIFGNILSAIGPVISMIAGLLIPIITALMPVVVTVFGVIADVIKSAMQIVQGIIEVVTGIITGNWEKVWSGILNIVSGVFGVIVGVISGAIQMFISIIGAGLNIVVSTFTGIFSGIVSYLATSWKSITDGAGRMLGDLVGFFGSIGGKIVGALGNIGSLLFNTGKNIIQGLIDGIGSMMGAIGRAVLSIVPEAIRGPFESLLGIHSPSRVFMGYGVNIGQGLINGMDGMHDKIAGSVEGLVDIPRVPSFGAGSYTPAGYAGVGSGVTYNTTINQVDDPIGTSHAVQRRLGALAV